MEINYDKKPFPFLKAGGELGSLTRNFDWAATCLGDPEGWPQNLRLTLSMILTSKFPMFLWWGDELIQFYNDAYRPSLGNDGKHPLALGQKAKDCWPEIWDIIYPLIDQVRTTGQATWSEDQLIPIYRNGQIEDVYWTFGYSAIMDDLGQVEGVLVVCTETTGKMQAIKSLEESERQMRAMVENIPFPIGVYVGKEMRIEIANKSIMDVWGKGEDVIGKLYKEILPELGNQEVFEQLDAVFETGVAFHARTQRIDLVVDNKLKPYYFNYSFTPLRDLRGNIYGVMNTAADITDLSLAQLKVEESERNLRQTILQAPVAMCIFKGPNHVVELANERMFELWGKSSKDVMNKPIFEGLPEAKDQGFEAVLDGVYTTGRTFSAEGAPITLPRDGAVETVYVNFVYEAYHEAGGTISGILALAVDVTPQVLARQKIEEVVTKRTQELEHANNNLQKSNAELAQFAYIASHDLQEPLRKISTFAQMLEKRMEKELDSQAKNYLEKINSSSSRMNSLIQDVLSYSELEKKTNSYSSVDLNTIVEGIITDYELLIEQKGAKITVLDLPTLVAIPLQMSQLFSNLIGNSLKFSRKEVKPVITISASILGAEEKQSSLLDPLADYYKIRFADNGIGFKEEYADQIFNIFQRLHRKSEYEGTGIGLAMCKKITLNHHGDLNAEGSSEEGAVFNIMLPMCQSDVTEQII